MSAVSSSFRAHYGVHSEKSAISLSLKTVPASNPGSLVIRFRSGTRSDPCISSVSYCDHDYYFELLREEERDAQSITRCSTAHHRDFRAVPRANRTFSTARNPIPYASSSTGEPRVGGPWRPWRSSVPAASPGENTCCAIPEGCAPSPAPLPPAGSATSNCLAW